MARLKTLLDLLDELEPGVRKAFEASIANIRSDVQIAALEAAIASGDVGAAIEAIGLDASYFRPLDEALRAAHLAGGGFAIAAVKAAGARQGVKVTGMFDSRNFRAEGILRQWSSDKVVQISTDTLDAVREALTDAITRGTAPRSAALDLVGRVGPGGVRSGGIVGLDSTKAGWVRNMADALSAENGVGVVGFDADGKPIKKFWIGRDGKLKSTFTDRDKRFDRLIVRAIKDGKSLSQADIARSTTRYTGRLQKLRGEAIARTELLGSLHAAQAEGLQQLVDSGQVAPDAVTVEWDASSDSATRDTHRAADGQIRQQGEPFSVGGYAMRFPGDSSMGAPAGEIINCRCVLRPRVDFIKGLKERLTPEELARARVAI
jgi:hypothetical protein